MTAMDWSGPGAHEALIEAAEKAHADLGSALATIRAAHDAKNLRAA
jgi:hypothetical protein